MPEELKMPLIRTREYLEKNNLNLKIEIEARIWKM